MGNLGDQPRLLKGAFVEYGISIPPLLVVFQFNPETIQRNRSNSYSAPGKTDKSAKNSSIHDFHRTKSSLENIQELQEVNIGSESISFDIRLDATMESGTTDIANQPFGISPQLSTLELMMHPKSESIIGELLNLSGGFSFTGIRKPPLILFVWGRKKVLPVNINSMNIKEEEYSPDLNPIRATVSVDLAVIEGPNIPYAYSKAMKELMSMLNLTNVTKVVNTLIP